MNKTAAVITGAADKLNTAGYVVTVRHEPRRGSDTPQPMVWVRNGNLLATLSGNNDGVSVFVSMVIDYGDYGTSFCDGAHLKSTAGLVRRVVGFLGEPKAMA